ncbi:UNVERIFIED_ORG: hypothetical protein BDU10_5438 [Burkholderia sp. CF145]
MMGQRSGDQEQLFYAFKLDDHVPKDRSGSCSGPNAARRAEGLGDFWWSLKAEKPCWKALAQKCHSSDRADPSYMKTSISGERQMSRLLWTQRQNFGPADRWGSAMTFDPVRERTVLFDGSNGSADTWEWDGQFWTQVSDMGPQPRNRHQMAWDSSSNRVILFGGAVGTGDIPQLVPFHDTWEWDGERWIQLDDQGPPPRYNFGLASDTTRNRVVLFGGELRFAVNDQVLGDTWEWDGTAWSQLEETGPSPRTGLCMTFDSVRGRVVLFGGSLQGDTWEWNGTVWVRVSEFGPPRRAFAAFDFDGSEAILFGGESEGFLGDTWSWDGRFWTQRQDIGPLPRAFAAMAFDSSRKRIVLFGGSSRLPPDSGLGDTWELAERPTPTS